MFDFIKSLFSRKSDPKFTITTTLTTTSPNTDYTPDPVRELLKEATHLKKEKKYDEACDKLKEAYSMPGASNLTIKEKLRLPMYLQLAKKGDEAWRLLGEMERGARTNPFEQFEIANQSRIFLQKEKNYTKATYFAIMSICYEIKRERFSDEISRERKEQLNKMIAESEAYEIYENSEQEDKDEHDYYVRFNEKLARLKSSETVERDVTPLLKKAKMSDIIEDVCIDIVKYLNSTENYNSVSVNNILNNHFANHYGKA